MIAVWDGSCASTVILSNCGNFDADDFWYPLNDLIEKHLEE